MIKVSLLKDLLAQPIKFYHNLCSICIEKISLSLPVAIQAAPILKRIEQMEEMQKKRKKKSLH